VLFTPGGGSAVFACPTHLGGGPLAVVLWRPGAFTQLTGQSGDSFATGISDDNGALDLFSMELTTHAITRLDLSGGSDGIPTRSQRPWARQLAPAHACP
jgi:hypothetical protein